MAERKYTITLEDGRTFPASADASVTPEEVLAEAERSTGVRVKTLDVDAADYSPKSLATDAARGFVQSSAGLIDLATMPARLMSKAVTDIREKGLAAPGLLRGGAEGFNAFPQSEATTAALDEYLPEKPALTPARRYTRAGLGGLAGAVAAPMGGPAINLAAGVAGGLGSEAAVDVAGEGMVPRVVGGMAGGAGVGLARAGFNAAKDRAQGIPFNMRNLAEHTLRGSDPANLEIAAQRMRDATAKGKEIGAAHFEITAAQAMLRDSNLQSMQDFLANTRHGVRTQNILRKQPSQIRSMGQIMQSRLPGEVTSPHDTANRMQKAATSHVESLKGKASNALLTELPKGTLVEVPRIEAFSRALDRYAESHPNVFAADLAKAVKAQLSRAAPPTPPNATVGSGLVSGKLPVKAAAKQPDYLTDAYDLKAAVDEVLGGFGKNDPNMKVTAAQANRYAENIRTLFEQTISTPGTPMAKGKAAYAKIAAEEIDPAKKSIVGRLMGPKGASDVKESPLAAMQALFKRGTPPGGLSEIRQAEAALRPHDPTAFVDAVKTHLADTLTAQLPPPGHALPQDLAKRWFKAIAGNPAQSQGLDDMISGVAKSAGVPEAPLVKGFRNFAELLAMAERIPARISGMPAGDISDVAGASMTASVLEARAIRGGLGHKLRSVYSGKAYDLMDKLLTTPEGLETLQKLAKTGSKHPGSLVLLQGFLQGLASNEAPITEPK